MELDEPAQPSPDSESIVLPTSGTFDGVKKRDQFAILESDVETIVPPPSPVLDSATKRNYQLIVESDLEANNPGHEQWVRRSYYKWKSPLIMASSFTLGLGVSAAHCALYKHLDGKVVGSPAQQETNLRQADPSWSMFFLD
jgi:hypothetical protein